MLKLYLDSFVCLDGDNDDNDAASLLKNVRG